MDRIIVIIAHTPLWVWPLLVGLLWLGWRAGQTRSVTARQHLILPAAILIMSGSTLLSFGPNALGIGIWAGGSLAGVGFGWISQKDEAVAVDRERGLLRIQGEWKTLALIIFIFALRYYWGYKSATAPEFVAIPTITSGYIGLNGLFSGIFVGWHLRNLYIYHRAPTKDLS